MTIIHVVRHGEVHNPEAILYGRLPDYHLSELGRQMAQAAADHLADRDVTYVVSSPLERAQETAAPIAQAHGLQVFTDLGELQGLGQLLECYVGCDGALEKCHSNFAVALLPQ